MIMELQKVHVLKNLKLVQKKLHLSSLINVWIIRYMMVSLMAFMLQFII